MGIALTIAGCPAAERIAREVTDAAASVAGISRVDLDVGVMTPDERRELTELLRDGRAARVMPFGPDSLTRVIAVTSGKGGVGKSTLTANLAVALAARGLSVGLIDADVHGFSIPGLLGLVDAEGRTQRPTRIDELIVPPIAYDVKTVSIGMFLREGEEGSAVAWRGPMLHRTVQQFLTDVFFGDLDVLLLDMPPGTGDVAISVGQLLPHAEVLVVTTPQSAASDVAIRSGLVARQTGQRVVGVVENMAAMTLPDGTVLDLFGSGGGAGRRRRAVERGGTRAAARLDPAQPGASGGRRCRHPRGGGASRRSRCRRDRTARRDTRDAAARPRRAIAVGPSEPVSARYVASESNGGVSPGVKPVRSGADAVDATAAPAAAARTVGHRRVVEQRLADDPARVVLSRVERPPVDVVEVLAHLLFDARLRRAQVLARAGRPVGQGLGVARKPLGADEQGSDDTQHEKLLDRHPEEHTPRLPPRGWLPIRLPRLG